MRNCATTFEVAVGDRTGRLLDEFFARLRVTRWGTAACVVALAACGTSDSPGDGNVPFRQVAIPGPSIIFQARIRLQETDSLFVARPSFLAARPTGGYYITDTFQKHVVEYSEQGVPIRVFGKEGSGPGEFLSVGPPMRISGTLLAIPDARKGSISLFNPTSSAYINDVFVDGIVRDFVVYPNAVVFGAINISGGTGLARWNTEDNEFSYDVALPWEYGAVKSGGLAGIFNDVLIERMGSSIIVGYQATNYLLRVVDREIVDTIILPVAGELAFPPIS